MILRILAQTAALMVLTAGAGVLTWRFHPYRPELYLTSEAAGPGEITVTEAVAKEKATGAVWLDARRAEEFAKGHIPGALLLNEYDWENLLMPAFSVISEAPEGRPVIIYCDGQKCAASRAVREKLQETPLGDRELFILRGGFPAWAAAGYPQSKS